MKNQTNNYDFTIVVPVYNEQDNVAALEKAFMEYLPDCLYKSCVLFVNDGSVDDSGPRLKEICKRNEPLFYLEFEKNAGLSAALKAGFDVVNSKYVGYMDADLQTTPQDFNLLLSHIEEYPMVIGIRANRKDSGFKKLQSKIANGFRRSMTHDGITDTGCPLKVIKTSYAKQIPLFTGMHRFLPALIQLQEGGRVLQIPVRHFPRVAGKSKYHLWNRLAGPFMDCFAYRWMSKRYIKYSIKDSDIID